MSFDPNDIEQVVVSWRLDVFSRLAWSRDAAPPNVHHAGGPGGGFFVTAEGFPFRAFLKPTAPLFDHTPWPAVEKIAADLAFELDLPVPPTVLYRREDAADGEEERACVSLVLHEPFDDLQPNWQPTEDERQQTLALLRPASGIVAFDGWIQNVDRNDTRPNTVIYRPTGSAPFAAFIDHANSLNRQDRWVKGGFANVSVPQMPSLLHEAVDPPRVAEVIERIEAFSDDRIDEIVTRIPVDYQSEDRAQVVCQALKERRLHLRKGLESLIN